MNATKESAGRRGNNSQSEDLEAGANCLDCNERLVENSKCIERDNCSNWICLKCSGLSKAKFEAISEEPDDMIWFCRHCRIALPAMKNILKAITKMEDKHEALAVKQDALENRVVALEETPKQAYRATDDVAKEIKEEVQEAIQKERNRLSLIIRGIPMNADVAGTVQALLETVGTRDDFKEQPITTRLGSSNEDNKQPLVKMVCENADQKYKIQKNSRRLATCDRTEERYIGPDLTRKERVSNKQMRDELKERRERGEANLTIRGNKIVSLAAEPREAEDRITGSRASGGRREAGGGPQGGGK